MNTHNKHKTIKVLKLHYHTIGEIFTFVFVGKLASCACVDGANVEGANQTCNFCNSSMQYKVKA
jgi:transcription elongation factor Elf1